MDELHQCFKAAGLCSLQNSRGMDAGAALELIQKGEPFLIAAAARLWPASARWTGVTGVLPTFSAQCATQNFQAPACGVDGPQVPLVMLRGGPSAPLRSADDADCEEGPSYGSRPTVCSLSTALDCVAGARTKDRPAAYIKDWHMCRDAPAVVAADAVYSVPLPFADDWLNWYFDARTLADCGENSSDYRFCYIGSARSWTPLHHDVLSSCSWSANVFGWKLWLFIRPPQVPTGSMADTADTEDDVAERTFARLAAQLRDPVLHDSWGNLRFCSLLLHDEMQALERATVEALKAADESEESRHRRASCGGAAAVSAVEATAAAAPASAPGASSESDPFRARRAARERLQHEERLFYCLQPPGSAVFVPPGWYHEVHNIGAVASINHNWFGAASLPHAWSFLRKEVAAARESIADCRSAAPAGTGSGSSSGRISCSLAAASSTAVAVMGGRMTCQMCGMPSGSTPAEIDVAAPDAACDTAVPGKASTDRAAAPASAAAASRALPFTDDASHCVRCVEAAASVDWEWESEVQRLVKVNSGFNYDEVSTAPRRDTG